MEPRNMLENNVKVWNECVGSSITDEILMVMNPTSMLWFSDQSIDSGKLYDLYILGGTVGLNFFGLKYYYSNNSLLSDSSYVPNFKYRSN